MDDHQHRTNRSVEGWLVGLLVLYALGMALWLLRHEVRVTLEDGFYYLKIAQNVARGAGSTFDGLNLTNGYHPLWMLTLVPLFWLEPESTIALTYIIILQALFTGAAMALFYYTVRLRCGRFAASLAALLWPLLTHRVTLGGLEFSLHALTLFATAYVYLRWFRPACPQDKVHLLRSGRHDWLLGLLLALTFLARLDTILLAGILILWLTWPDAVYLRDEADPAALKATRRHRVLALSLPLLLVILSYLVINLSLFSHPLPVSGTIKRDWSIHLLNQDPRYLAYSNPTQGWVMAKRHHLLWPWEGGPRLFPLSVWLGTYGLLGVWLLSGLGSGRMIGGLRQAAWSKLLAQILAPWPPFILFSLLSFLSYALVYHGSLSFPPWYYVIQPWLSILLLVQVGERVVQAWLGHDMARIAALKPSLRALLLFSLMGLWLSAPLYTFWSLEQWRRDDRSGAIPQCLYKGAAWVKTNLPPETRLGAWNAGAIGYLSERQVVNLDGLVNSWAYYQTEGHDLCTYWQQQGITHIIDIFDYRTAPVEAIAPTPTYPHYATCADQLALLWTETPSLPPASAEAWWRLDVYRLRPDE